MQGYLKVVSQFKNLQVAGNDKSFVENMKAAFQAEFLYLPNIYLGDWKFKAPKPPEGARPLNPRRGLKAPSGGLGAGLGILNVGCFGAIRPMKNHLQQALASVMLVSELGLKLRFHVNALTEQRGDNALKNIRALMAQTGHELVLHSWYKHADFLQLIKQMDIGLQVSLTESFNIVAADFVHQDVPIVVSPDISWASQLYTANPNCAESIKRRMLFALRFRHLNLHYLNKLALKKYNVQAMEGWREYFGIA
jgi:hypothetical protein